MDAQPVQNLMKSELKGVQIHLLQLRSSRSPKCRDHHHQRVRRSSDHLKISVCSAVAEVFSISSVMPRIPFIGVRNLVAHVGQNSLLARLADSAASLAISEHERAPIAVVPQSHVATPLFLANQCHEFLFSLALLSGREFDRTRLRQVRSRRSEASRTRRFDRNAAQESATWAFHRSKCRRGRGPSLENGSCPAGGSCSKQRGGASCEPSA